MVISTVNMSLGAEIPSPEFQGSNASESCTERLGLRLLTETKASLRAALQSL